MSIADRLEGAAALIEERGGCRNYHIDPTGRLCVIGAALLADTGGARLPEVEDSRLWDRAFALMAAIYEAIDSPEFLDHYASISGWNDAPGRTDPERVALLRKAAALARAQEGLARAAERVAEPVAVVS